MKKKKCSKITDAYMKNLSFFFFSYINLRLAFHAARSLPLGERENEEKKKIKNVAVKFLRISEKCYFKSIKQEKKEKENGKYVVK